MGYEKQVNSERHVGRNGEPSIFHVKEILIISADGHTINVQRGGERTGTFLYEQLPSKYWDKYNAAAVFVNNVKASTAKITWITEEAKCKLMENGSESVSESEANFEVEFEDGRKYEYDVIKNIVTVSKRKEGSSTLCVEEKFDAAKEVLISQRYGSTWELFKSYRARIKEIEKRNKDFEVFPMRLGLRKMPGANSTSSLMPSSYGNVNLDNIENRNLYANQYHAFPTSEIRLTPSQNQHMPVLHQNNGRQNRNNFQTRSAPDFQGNLTNHRFASN